MNTIGYKEKEVSDIYGQVRTSTDKYGQVRTSTDKYDQ